MEISSTRKLCRSLIASAIRRCRISENPCRLSVLLKISPDSDPPLARIAISDTGVGSSLAEFQDVEHGRKQISVENWDGVLFITTTNQMARIFAENNSFPIVCSWRELHLEQLGSSIDVERVSDSYMAKMDQKRPG